MIETNVMALPTAIICPNCDTPLVTRYYDLHAVEACPTCMSMLVDASELHEHVIETTKNDKIMPAPDVNAKDLIRPFPINSKRSCPRDGAPFRCVNYGYDSNVLLEQCPVCNVLWIENTHILPLARYLKSRPELINLGEDIRKRIEHQDIEEHGLAHYPIVITKSPILLGDTAEPLSFSWVVSSLIVLQIILYFSHVTVAANILHLLGNLFTLWIFGDNVESRYGSKLFVVFYCLSGIVSAGIATLIFPNANTLMTAASGAITALMGSYIVLYPKEKMRILFLNSIWGVTAWKYLLFWLIVQLIGFIAENATGTIYMISSATHLIGFVFGVITTLVLKEKRVLIREANFYKNTYFDQK